MLPVGWLVAIVALAIVLTTWVTFTLTRLDRLHARVDAAQAALDAQLVRRAAALQHLVETSPDVAAADRQRFEPVARAALEAEQDDTRRQAVENAVGRAVAELADRAPGSDPATWSELDEAAARVLIARRFYNDAVRDTRNLRSGRLPRLLRMAGRRAMPEFFDIDDTPPSRPVPTPVPQVPAPAPAPTMEEDRS